MNKKKVKRLIIAAVALCLAGGGAGGAVLFGGNGAPWEKDTNVNGQSGMWAGQKSAPDSRVTNGEMQVTFLDVGQGDCTIVRTGDADMIIDCGDKEYGDYIVEYLQVQGIESLDYMVLTHPDADHIGGADEVLEAFEVECVLMPDVKNDTRAYEDVMEVIDSRRIPVEHPQVETQYTLGDAVFRVLCPEEELVKETDMNGSSVGIQLVYGENSFVMCGDAEETSERAMAERFGGSLESDVLKCGHHGSSRSTTDAFLKAVNPTWAVISCGEGNSYGHPHREVIAALEDDDIQVYRTDRQGTIVAVSDGKNLKWSAEK